MLDRTVCFCYYSPLYVTLVTEAPLPAFVQALASVKHDYQCMRREQDRVLSMWQQEKLMRGVLEQHRAKTQQQVEQELIVLRQTLDSMRAQQRTAEAESDRLKDMLDDTLRQFQQHIASEQKSRVAASAQSSSSSCRGAHRLSISLPDESDPSKTVGGIEDEGKFA